MVISKTELVGPIPSTKTPRRRNRVLRRCTSSIHCVFSMITTTTTITVAITHSPHLTFPHSGQQKNHAKARTMTWINPHWWNSSFNLVKLYPHRSSFSSIGHEIALDHALFSTWPANQLMMSPSLRGSNPYPYGSLTYRNILFFKPCSVYTSSLSLSNFHPLFGKSHPHIWLVFLSN